MIKTLKIMLYAAILAVVFVTVTKQAVAMVMTDSPGETSQTTQSTPMVIYQNTNNG